MRLSLSPAFAILFGLIVLAGYFLPFGPLLALNTVFLNWAVILTAVAALVAVIGLIAAHWRKLRLKRNPDRYSALVILAFIITLTAGIALGGPSSSAFQNIIFSIQLPLESSLMAVLAVSLLVAGYRLFKTRQGLMTVFFVLSVFLYLLINSGIWAAVDVPVLKQVLGFLQRLPAAGARGILVGIALGSLITGLRVLSGSERPYQG